MGKIHGVAYLGIGFFIAFVSWIFDFSKLWFFFIIGIVMAGYGLFRVSTDIHVISDSFRENVSVLLGVILGVNLAKI